jgi:hypothetical protein
MHRGFYHLDGSVIADIYTLVRWQRYLWEAESAWIRSFAGTSDLEHWNHGEGHIWWSAVWSIRSESQVDVEERRSVPLEPAWLNGYCSTADWP